ncbi:MAG: TonB-dependent receptor [Steroidobacteraceae bacterium]
MNRILLAVAVVAVVPGTFNVVHAQGAAEAGTLEEVIVTAERRAVDLQKTAVSVTAISGEDLQAKGITTLDKAIEESPSVKIASSPQGTGASIFIRGVGSNFIDPDRAAQPAVAINVDGVTNSTPAAVTSSMFDIERVEVLRGPQGTLYGSSAEGGVVNIVLADPKQDFEARGRVQVGNYSARETEAMLNLPLLDDVLAVRLTASNSKRDGYIRGVGIWVTPGTCAEAVANRDNDACDANGNKIPYAADNYGANETTVYRAKVKVTPADWLSMVGTYERTKIDGIDTRRVAPADFLSGNQFYSNLVTPYPTSDGHREYFNTNFKESYKLDIKADLGEFATLTLRPARATEDPTASAPSAPSIGSTQDTLEATLASTPASKLIWTVGAYVRKLTQDVRQNGSTVTAAVDDGRLSTYGEGRPFKEWNVFGQSTYPLTDSFRLTAGARYSHTSTEFDYLLYSTPGIAANTTVDLTDVTPYGHYSIESADSKLTWKVGAELDLAPESLGYVTVSTGYKAGGYGFQDSGVAVYAPDEIVLEKYKAEDSTALEIGSKNRFLGNTLQVNGDVYYNIWQNMQLKNSSACSVAFPNCDGTVMSETTQSIQNADRSIQYGLEIDTTWLATPNDRIGGNVSFMHGTYGAVLVRGFGGAAYQLDGHTMSNSPSVSGSVSYSHVFSLRNGATLTAKLSEQFSARYFNTQEYWIAGSEVPGYGKTDFSATLAKDSWTLNAFVRNAFNSIQNQFGHPQGYSPSEPRILGAGIAVSL